MADISDDDKQTSWFKWTVVDEQSQPCHDLVLFSTSSRFSFDRQHRFSLVLRGPLSQRLTRVMLVACCREKSTLVTIAEGTVLSSNKSPAVGKPSPQHQHDMTFNDVRVGHLYVVVPGDTCGKKYTLSTYQTELNQPSHQQTASNASSAAATMNTTPHLHRLVLHPGLASHRRPAPNFALFFYDPARPSVRRIVFVPPPWKKAEAIPSCSPMPVGSAVVDSPSTAASPSAPASKRIKSSTDDVLEQYASDSGGADNGFLQRVGRRELEAAMVLSNIVGSVTGSFRASTPPQPEASSPRRQPQQVLGATPSNPSPKRLLPSPPQALTHRIKYPHAFAVVDGNGAVDATLVFASSAESFRFSAPASFQLVGDQACSFSTSVRLSACVTERGRILVVAEGRLYQNQQDSERRRRPLAQPSFTDDGDVLFQDVVMGQLTDLQSGKRFSQHAWQARNGQHSNGTNHGRPTLTGSASLSKQAAASDKARCFFCFVFYDAKGRQRLVRVPPPWTRQPSPVASTAVPRQ